MKSELTEKEISFLAGLCGNIASQDTLATKKPVIWCLMDTRTFRDDGPDADSVEICRINGIAETPAASGWKETAELLNKEILPENPADIWGTGAKYRTAVPFPAKNPDSVLFESDRDTAGKTYKWRLRDANSVRDLLQFLNADMKFTAHGMREEREIVPGIFAFTRNGIEECAEAYGKTTGNTPILYCMNADCCPEIAKLAVILEKFGTTRENEEKDEK